jgi:hypothetical protein
MMPGTPHRPRTRTVHAAVLASTAVVVGEQRSTKVTG